MAVLAQALGLFVDDISVINMSDLDIDGEIEYEQTDDGSSANESAYVEHGVSLEQ